jgi:hypothetical protein
MSRFKLTVLGFLGFIAMLSIFRLSVAQASTAQEQCIFNTTCADVTAVYSKAAGAAGKGTIKTQFWSKIGQKLFTDLQSCGVDAATGEAAVGATLQQVLAGTFSTAGCMCQTNVTTTWSQADPLWKAVLLYNTVPSANKTIGNKGCALTSLGMALDFAGVTTLQFPGSTAQNDPGNLNSFMSQTDNDFVETFCKGTTSVCGADVNWQAATSDTSLHSVKFHYRNISSETNPNAAKNYLHDQLCNGHPVIVGVKLKNVLVDGVTKRVPRTLCSRDRRRRL